LKLQFGGEKMNEAFEKHQEKVINEMHERFTIYNKMKKKERLLNCSLREKK
jgi:hypothetical protein